VATTTTDDSHEERAEEDHRSFLASFSPADLRLFLITFAGTVAANVVTVMVVAVAVIAARPKVSGRPTVGDVLAFLFCAICGIGFLCWFPVWVRDKRTKGKISPRENVLILIMLVLMGLITSEILLLLLGWAVGVK
jgi:hypothetical protein